MPDDLYIPPTYRELAAVIIERIDSGAYAYGSLLPAARELAHEFGVSRGTVNHALSLLKEQGAIVGRQGRGSIVVRRVD